MNLFWTQSVLVALEPVCGIERRVLKGISDVRQWTGNEFFCSQQQFCLEKASLLLWGLHELTCFVNSLGLIRILLLPVAHQTSHNCVNHWPCREQHCYWKRNRKTSHMPMRTHTHTPGWNKYTTGYLWIHYFQASVRTEAKDGTMRFFSMFTCI